jgi:hypothetical protein
MPPPLHPQQVADMLHSLDERLQGQETKLTDLVNAAYEPLTVWRKTVTGNVANLWSQIDNNERKIDTMLSEIRALKKMVAAQTVEHTNAK